MEQSHSHSHHSHSRRSNHSRSRSRERSKHKSHSIKIYISNIPSNTSEEKVKDEFSQFGEVIDYSFKKKGKSSYYYGYVKMKNKNEAKDAIDYISKNLEWKVSMDKNEKKIEQKKKV
jgi:RNA recognition motif-containing protein